ncbi:hypothetical protein Bca52824_027179 [Brassica carinata]|uniref:Uncharacterized protein n=1 Tax=Brassica carinata TaxID=52824 RepID=A0A8X7VAF4_BRACI|nr:hypothetical protein Bca52824_027179 [Brassica carinata]
MKESCRGYKSHSVKIYARSCVPDPPPVKHISFCVNLELVVGNLSFNRAQLFERVRSVEMVDAFQCNCLRRHRFL